MPPPRWRREPILLAGLLVFTLALRAIRLDQPIVENYVGRQVPTAMVARNIERGSGFLRPQLDTAPFPNFFLVEPPVFALTVTCVRGLTGLPLEPAGRLVSALATVLAAWGLFGLARRREGAPVALLAVAAFALFPLTIRYGRAFQPDALMLGTLVAGLRCWDEHEAGGGWPWLAGGWALLALALALKVIAVYVLVPLVATILRPPRGWRVVLALGAVVPALLWYGHAWTLMSTGIGSRASSDNQGIWLGLLTPGIEARAGSLRAAAWFLAVRAFTPLGVVLAFWGLSRSPGFERYARFRVGSAVRTVFDSDEASQGPHSGPCEGDLHTQTKTAPDRLWLAWAGAALAALAVLAGKLHHEYYFLALAPVAAVGVAKGLAAAALSEWRWGRPLALGAGAGLIALSFVQSLSTWRTPAEWSRLDEAAAIVRAAVPRGVWLVAPEALLYAADRPGCRLEWGERASGRAAGEWAGTLEKGDPLALVEFYRLRGARFVADLAPEGPTNDPARLLLHEAVRRRYNLLVDRPGVLLAALPDPEDAPHGRR